MKCSFSFFPLCGPYGHELRSTKYKVNLNGFCTDVVGEETIQIENRLFLMVMIYFPRATGFCLRSTKYKVNLNGFI